MHCAKTGQDRRTLCIEIKQHSNVCSELCLVLSFSTHRHWRSQASKQLLKIWRRNAFSSREIDIRTDTTKSCYVKIGSKVISGLWSFSNWAVDWTVIGTLLMTSCCSDLFWFWFCSSCHSLNRLMMSSRRETKKTKPKRRRKSKIPKKIMTMNTGRLADWTMTLFCYLQHWKFSIVPLQADSCIFVNWPKLFHLQKFACKTAIPSTASNRIIWKWNAIMSVTPSVVVVRSLS